MLKLAAAGALALLLAACSAQSSFPDPAEPPLQASAPWPDYERLTYAIFDQTDAEIGAMIMETRRADGGTYELSLTFTIDESNTRDELTVVVDERTMKPIRYSRQAGNDEDSIEIAGAYERDGANLAATGFVQENDERQEIDLDAGEFAYDNDSSAWLWRRLRFEQDLELTYRSVNLFQRRSQLVQVAVRGQDTLPAPDGDALAWQVVVTPGVEIQRAWYEVGPPHRLLRWDQQPRRFVLTEIATSPE